MVIRQSKNNGTKQSRSVVLQQNHTKSVIKQTQHYMSELVSNLGNLLPFDNTVVPDDCVDRLVAHRITTKFHVEDASAAKALQTAAFSKYIDYDAGLNDDVIIEPYSVLSRARRLLHEWFSDFEVDYSDSGYTVSPGETFISSGGEVSLLSKLFDKNHWTVTANCLDDACKFIYHNLSFKRAAKHHIGVITRKEKRKLYLKFRNKPDIGYHVFKYLLIDRVLIIVDGARASSVPKSNEQRRFINIEAMFSVILQRAASFKILEVLARVGNDMDNFRVTLTSDINGLGHIERSAQKLHGILIASCKYATIDFSNASDSVTLSAVAKLFPKQLYDVLFRLRSHYVIIEDEFHMPKKLSSMGNGFTFEVMTSMLYAICRVFTNDCRVYGDDVIIPNEFADDFVGACELIDFRVNEKKTFIRSFFRESCGYFYSDHINNYITSFDFGQILSLSDVVITCNKLSVIIDADQISLALKDKLILTRDRISALAHASRKGPLPEFDFDKRKFLASYIFDEGYVKKQRRSKDLRTLRQHYIEKNSQYFDLCQIERSDAGLIYIPFFVPHRSRHVFTSGKDLEVLLPALYSGKRLNATLKGKGKWVDLPAFVFSDGTVTLISNLTSPQEIWVDRLNGVFTSHEKL